MFRLLSPDLVELIHDDVLNPNELAGRARDTSLEGALSRVDNRLSYGMIEDVFALAAFYAEAVAQGGFSADASFLIGGQVGDRSPKIYMVYPQGNFITSSDQTPFLQIGEFKYGKAILDRIIDRDTDLEFLTKMET